MALGAAGGRPSPSLTKDRLCLSGFVPGCTGGQGSLCTRSEEARWEGAGEFRPLLCVSAQVACVSPCSV